MQTWVGRALRFHRLEAALEQADVAQLMSEHFGIEWTQGIVANIERGARVVTLLEAMCLCVVLGVSLNDFLYCSEYHGEITLENPKGEPLPVVPTYVTTGGDRYMLAYALGEVLADGLIGSTAHSWGAIHKSSGDEVDPSKVLHAAEELRGDPDFEKVMAACDLSEKEVKRRLQLVGKQMLGQKGPFTAMELVDYIVEDMLSEKPKDVNERGRRVLRVHARLRLAEALLEAR